MKTEIQINHLLQPDPKLQEPTGHPPQQEEIRQRLADRRACGPNHPYSQNCACDACRRTKRSMLPIGSWDYWLEKENDYTDHDYLSGKDWKRHDEALDLPAGNKERDLTLELLRIKRGSSLASHCASTYYEVRNAVERKDR